MRAKRSQWSEVTVGGTRIAVHRNAPMAVLRPSAGPEQVVAWPDLDVGARAVESRVIGGPSGAWVLYRPLDAEDETVPSGRSSAIHVPITGEVTRSVDLGRCHAIGATRHGLWLTDDGYPDTQDAEGWRREQRILVLGHDGTRGAVVLDRKPALVRDHGQTVELVVFSAPPIVHRSSLGGATFTYLHGSIRLGGDLPARLAYDDVEFEDVSQTDLMELMRSSLPEPPIEPPTTAVVAWDRIALSPADQRAAVDAVAREFADLGRYWTAEDGTVGPLAGGLTAPRIDVVGDWPRTRVEVSFQYSHHYPDGRLRRVVPVFDDAGRAIPATYGSIHLMEDLHTAALPEPSGARDGVLTI